MLTLRRDPTPTHSPEPTRAPGPRARSALLVAGAALALSALPGAGLAQPADDDGIAGVEEIVVTITKRAERVQDIAGSITAFSDDQLGDADIEQISDLVALLPNVQIKGGGNGSVSIRGISKSFTSQSPVAFHTNGVFAFDGLYGQIYDSRSVEIQRGPVGTVYGRNATAGAINVNWNEPNDRYEVFGDATVGNFSTYQFRGGVNIPLLGEGDERLMGRIVVQRLVHDGYLRNLTGTRHQSPENADDFTARMSLRSVLSEDLEITARGFWHQSKALTGVGRLLGDTFPVGEIDFGPLTGGPVPFDVYGGLQQFIQANLSGATLLSFLGRLLNPADPAAGIQETVLNGFPASPLTGGIPIPPIILRESVFTPALPIPSSGSLTRSAARDVAGDPVNKRFGFDGTLSWNVHDVPVLGDFEVRLVGGWYRIRDKAVSDGDGTEVVLVDTGQFSKAEQYTADFQLVSQNDDALSWILGVFYFDRTFFLDRQSFLPFGLFVSLIDQHDTGIAPYMNAAWRPFANMENPIADIEIFGGVRWNKDKITRDLFEPAVPLRAESDLHGGEKFREVTGEAGMKWFWADGQMVYVKWSRGYKAGGFNDDGPAFDPEIIKAWEVGSKSEIFDSRLQLNFTGFLYDYSDLQVPQIQGLTVRTLNAAKATIFGLEAEIVARPVPEWTIAVTAGYLDATFDEFCAEDLHQAQAFDDPGCERDPGGIALTASNGIRNLSDNRLEDSPRWTTSLYSTYEWDLADWGTVTSVVEFSWTDDQFLRPFNLQIDRVDSRTKTDLRLVWRSPTGRYSVELFGQQLEDENVFAAPVVLPENFGGALATLGFFAPRTYGVRIGFRWGSDS